MKLFAEQRGERSRRREPTSAASGLRTDISSPRTCEQPEILDEVWDAYEKAVENGRISLPPGLVDECDPYPGRYLNPHRKVVAFCGVLKHPRLLATLRLLMRHEPKPLQTIASHKGSQQAAHSDSIHMTTYPLGYLTAAWIAFEDIHPDAVRWFTTPAVTSSPMFSAKMCRSVSQIFRRTDTRNTGMSTSLISGG